MTWYHHHFIKDSQASYLRDSKENLDDKTCIIQLDFAENYSFIMQNVPGRFLLAK